MNKRQKEVLTAELRSEQKTLRNLKAVYRQAAKDCAERAAVLLGEGETTQSKIYQARYQKSLEKQLDTILDRMNSKNYSTLSEYLNDCYTNGFVGAMYDISGQGVPLILPIDQGQVIRSVQLDSKISEGLYSRMGKDTKALKKQIKAQISRGISNGSAYSEIARNINGKMDIGYNNAVRIVRTEGHRIQSSSALDAMHAAKEKGADVVKQWDSTLDGKTRESHRRLDGQLRELDEPFETDGKKASAPGHFGSPKEDCNCRCALLQRARWALDDEELKTLQERAEYFGLDKTSDFEDFREKYLKAVDISGESGIINTVTDNFKIFSVVEEVNEFFGGKGGILQRKKSVESRWLNSLTKDETAYVSGYTADGYDDVNKYLRNIDDDDINEAYAKAAIKNIDSAISKFELMENVTLFRGTDLDSLIEQFPNADNLSDLIGNEYCDKGYMSTSPLENVARRFAENNETENQLILQLDVTKGKGKCAYINKLSGFKNDEYECLIMHGSKFEIYGVDESGDIPILKARWTE